MSTIDGIRKLGFRKWYERQLIESHVWLVTMVLALVMAASGMELMTVEQGRLDALLDGVLVAAGAGLAWQSWRRYARAMMVAEHVGHQAVCPACQRYGFRAVPPADAGRASTPLQLLAACPRCGHRWPIDAGL